MTPDHGLDAPTARFVDDLTPLMLVAARNTPGIDPDDLRRDVEAEASHLVEAFIDSDGLHTDEELWAYIATFGPRRGGDLVRATPDDCRRAGLFANKRRFLDQPSQLFEVLVATDIRDGSSSAWAYYERAMALGHTVASLDTHTSHAELRAIERFRAALLASLETARIGPTATAATGGPTNGAPVTEAAAVTTEPPPPERTLEEVLAELHGLIGLDAVKTEVELVADLLYVQRLRSERDLPVPDTSRHLVFVGNPGTGKTTVARLLAQIYRLLGAVPRGQLIETDRSGLVAGYVGQTATRTAEVFATAVGGVLLIDEAYALARGEGGRDFGQEAIDTLVKLMEDHRADTVVVVAGYPDEMGVFIESNPGLRSRFPRTIHFPDYTVEELVEIFRAICAKHHYVVGEATDEAVAAHVRSVERDKGFGNGRLVRNLFEAATARQASRLRDLSGATTLTDEQLVTLVPVDIPPPPADTPVPT